MIRVKYTGTGNIIEKSSLLTVGKVSRMLSTTSLLTARDSALTVRNEAIQLPIMKWVSTKSQPFANNKNCICEVGEKDKPICVKTPPSMIIGYTGIAQAFDIKNHELSIGFFVKRIKYG